MKLKYKAVMFLTLLIFCVGSVCATDPDNTTHTNLTDNQNIENGLNNIISTCNDLKESNIKLSNEIEQLKDNNTQLDKRVKDLE